MRFAIVTLCAWLLIGCASQGLRIDDRYQAKSQSSRVQYIVLHYTSTDLSHSLALLTEGEVSAHYLIADNPATVYRLVDENRRAWHAGVSQWQGRTWLNASTLGIEIVNQGYRDGPDGRIWQPYSEAQIQALIVLLKDLVKRHQLPVDSIIGHSDIAPQRKVDPGPLFPWRRLAEAGLIRWPDAGQVALRQGIYQQALPNALWFQQQLAKAGYAVEMTGQFDKATQNVLMAFQMKYRASRYDGVADAETAALLDVLNRH